MLANYQYIEADLAAKLTPGLTWHCDEPCPQRELADPGSDQTETEQLSGMYEPIILTVADPQCYWLDQGGQRALTVFKE